MCVYAETLLQGVNQSLHIGGYGRRVQGATPKAQDRIKRCKLKCQ